MLADDASVAAAAPSAVPVSVATVERRETGLWHDFSGRLEAVERVDIRSRVSGAVQSVHFREGGLEAGERIVVNGLHRVRPGAVVAPQMVSMYNPSMPAGGTSVAQR